MMEASVCDKRPSPHESLTLYKLRECILNSVPLIISKATMSKEAPDRLPINIICLRVIFTRARLVLTMLLKMMRSTIKKFHRSQWRPSKNLWNKMCSSCQILGLKSLTVANRKIAKKWGHFQWCLFRELHIGNNKRSNNSIYSKRVKELGKMLKTGCFQVATSHI